MLGFNVKDCKRKDTTDAKELRKKLNRQSKNFFIFIEECHLTDKWNFTASRVLIKLIRSVLPRATVLMSTATPSVGKYALNAYLQRNNLTNATVIVASCKRRDVQTIIIHCEHFNDKATKDTEIRDNVMPEVLRIIQWTESNGGKVAIMLETTSAATEFRKELARALHRPVDNIALVLGTKLMTPDELAKQLSAFQLPEVNIAVGSPALGIGVNLRDLMVSIGIGMQGGSGGAAQLAGRPFRKGCETPGWPRGYCILFATTACMSSDRKYHQDNGSRCDHNERHALREMVLSGTCHDAVMWDQYPPINCPASPTDEENDERCQMCIPCLHGSQLEDANKEALYLFCVVEEGQGHLNPKIVAQIAKGNKVDLTNAAPKGLVELLGNKPLCDFKSRACLAHCRLESLWALVMKLVYNEYLLFEDVDESGAPFPTGPRVSLTPKAREAVHEAVHDRSSPVWIRIVPFVPVTEEDARNNAGWVAGIGGGRTDLITVDEMGKLVFPVFPTA
jgi:hypothetical protein